MERVSIWDRDTHPWKLTFENRTPHFLPAQNTTTAIGEGKGHRKKQMQKKLSSSQYACLEGVWVGENTTVKKPQTSSIDTDEKRCEM